MTKNSEFVIALITPIAIFVIFFMGFAAGSAYTQNKFHKETVDRGLAIYNPTNRNWQWKE